MTGVPLSQIRENVVDNWCDVNFMYGDKFCSIEIYTRDNYSLFYGDDEFSYSSFDELINDPVFDGKCFSEIVEIVDFYEYG